MTTKEKIKSLKERLEEHLNGLVICDEITRKEAAEELRYFNKWSKTANWGDAFISNGACFKLQKEERK